DGHVLVARAGASVAVYAIHERVADVPEARVLVLVLDLEIAERSAAARAPVDQPLPSIDQPIVEELLERRAHRGLRRLVEREDFSRPVRRSAQPAVLLADDRAVLP